MIIVTAGHVDHGKTSLLHALTGTHTSHLPEEKKRGLTIDLGYAYLAIENDILGFIDVPGHQKFLSNMLAGLGGIQHALLVVSVEEGIKPQTIEHLGILKLLNFSHIMVVITKADRSNDEQIQSLITQLKQQFDLSSSKFFVTSAQTGQGIAELKTYLISLNHTHSKVNQPFRYAIDRVFHVKGTGLVVTGTAIAGKVKIGDEIYLSNELKVRVRKIHAQNNESSEGIAGQRLALNIANVEKEQIQRGDWLTQLAPTQASERITIQLTAAQSIKENSIIHLYHYASHITAKLNLLNATQAVRNGNYFAEIICDDALHFAIGDKLIIRNGDDSQTIAGGVVLEIHSPKRHKRSDARLAYLKLLSQADQLDTRLALYTQHQTVNLSQLLWQEQIFLEDIAILSYQQHSKWLFNNAFKQQVQQNIIDKLSEYHQQHNDQLGVTKARLHRIAALDQPEDLIYHFIDELLAEQKLSQTRGWIHTPDHRIEFNHTELQIWAEIRPLFERTNQALWVRNIANELSIDENEMRNLLYKAGKLGYLVPIVKDRFLLHEQISQFAQLIKQFIQQNGEISVNQLRDEIQYGRKLTVQLIEYFDRSGFLRRKGNVHLLRDRETY
ncbi:selenocysteine-specific translation elongation factor [Ursidibacter maritimus]|uniref:Selenocysteine-specific elongation factor n=1 Tax=Ursidibacter maritimus TaxID=1331689 RepID=A0A949T843_9PAST|nr:selenocysteine-specific translation elongation factor [Ursidibacter maritimus]KAE9540115.1 selenocysteine-specific translation elongation factor [Ursidibacter maritimus]MBV6524374.1 selenocysteine-specific translation elongation factor [Ursidibacter maritimus]MBV6526560.1 selenocysteine-specific translation elongation factor [Ursidibacter maritimus]MBV6527807.1 selenocysteine-specific translation elongation factor [Ursidibacter maritimus]MBV6530126.1 selenocysteine-specific translation elon